MDDTDLAILDALQENARTANADIARRLGMAPSAIHQRLKKLEESGVIRGYAAQLDPVALERGLLAFVYVKSRERLADASVGNALADMPEVLEVHDIAGEDCYLLKVRVADTDALHELLHRKLGAIESVDSTSSVIVLKTVKESSRIPVER